MNNSDEASSPRPAHSAHPLRGILLLTLFLIASVVLARYYTIDVAALRKTLAAFPFALSAGVFIVLYVAVSFFVFFSKDLFWLVGALLFGPLASTVCVYIAECANAAIFWKLARMLGSPFVQKSLSARHAALAGRLRGISFGWLLLLRATPLVPYRFLDIGAGACGVRFRRYFAAVALGSWVKIAWVQYVLAAVGQAALTDPAEVARFYLGHQAWLWMSAGYLLLVALAAYKVKKLL